jgi:wyosine [tRNA(Phe)-imidazoG37] synthetase (radical SAM superfamily)
MKIYGPVPSWRLGNSLGVDLVEAPKNQNKICSFDCIYCQLGYNEQKTNKPKKIAIEESEFRNLKKRIDETEPDYITFSGQGEPTLNLNLGYAAKRMKKISDIPIAVLTNASLLNNTAIRKELDCCDLVIAKIDAPNQELFEKINRPYEDQPYEKILLKSIIDGIKQLKTKVAIQTLLFSYNGLTNADKKSINGLIKIYNQINKVKPIGIFLGTAYRPSGLKGVRAIDKKGLKEIALHISKETGIKAVYYKEVKQKKISRQLQPDELRKEIIKLLKRRPCTLEDISTRFSNTKFSNILDTLLTKGMIEKIIKNGKKFYFWR